MNLKDDKLEQQREHFNKIATNYKKGRTAENHILFKNLIWAKVFSHLDFSLLENARVLEAMCGFAEGYDILKNNYEGMLAYEGFDYSDEVVSQLKLEKPELKVFFADATKYQPLENTYDVIILIGGLHHIPDYAKTTVKNLSKGLKPGGYFINFEPTEGNAIIKLIRQVIYKKNTVFDQETERAFSVNELKNMFQSATLSLHYEMHPGLLGYVLYYNPYAFPALNLGTKNTVHSIYKLENRLYDKNLTRYVSFCYLSVWKK